MQNRKPHRQKAPQTGHSIFGTILFSLLAVLAVEILLLTFAAHARRAILSSAPSFSPCWLCWRWRSCC